MFLDFDNIAFSRKTDPKIHFSPFFDRFDINFAPLHVEFLQNIEITRDQLRSILDYQRKT
jgi:hypothetical protein